MRFGNWVRNFKELGYVAGALYSVNRILGVFGVGAIYHYVIVAQPISEIRRLPAQRGRNIETQWLACDDPSLRFLPRPQRVIKSRFEQGSRCLGAYLENKLVGCLWYVERRYREDEVRCDFVFSKHDNCVWDFDVYVDPKYRVGYVFLKLWDDANEALYQSGFRWSLSRISAFNLASVRSHARLDAHVIGGATFLVLGSRQWCWSTFLSGVDYNACTERHTLLDIDVPAEVGRVARGKSPHSWAAVK